MTDEERLNRFVPGALSPEKVIEKIREFHKTVEPDKENLGDLSPANQLRYIALALDWYDAGDIDGFAYVFEPSLGNSGPDGTWSDSLRKIADSIEEVVDE